jgi:hypothetical protein
MPMFQLEVAQRKLNFTSNLSKKDSFFNISKFKEPKRFAVDLLQYLNCETQYLYSLLAISQSSSPPPSERLVNSQMALEALSNVIKHNRGSLKLLLI